MSSQPHLLLVGGGTAGHVNPLLATAAKLQASGARVSVLGGDTGLEKDLVPAAGLPLHTVERVSAPRSINADTFTFPARLRRVIKDVDALVEELSVDAIVGFGGYVSAPAYWVGKRRHLPVVIHEQNARPGLANRVGAKWAHTVAVTFPGTPLEAKRGRSLTTGLPLRADIENYAAADADQRQQWRQRAARSFGLDPQLPTVLVTGGSLGAQRLNESVAGAATRISESAQVLHLTGKGKAEAVRADLDKAQLTHPWEVREYCEDMVSALAVADLVVCRAGAGTVAELSAIGMPAIYVPLAIGNGEQKLNARSHVESGGAVLIENASFDRDVAAREITDIIANEQRLVQMRQNSARLGGSQAAVTFAKLCLEAAAS